VAGDAGRQALTSRRPSHAVILVAYAALISVVFFPIVFGGESLLSSPLMPGTFPWGPPGVDVEAVRHAMDDRSHVLDVGALPWMSEPWAVAAGRMYRHGELPLWNPSMGLGAPLAANMVSGVFSLLRLPVLLWPRPIVWNVYFLARLLIVGFFTYVFLRRLAISPLNAFAGGAALMLTGHFVVYVNHWDLDTGVLLPVVMVATDMLLRARSVGAIVALGLAGGIAALAASPESLVMIGVFAGAYFVVRSATVALRARRFGAAMWQYVRPLLWSVLLAIVIALPLFVLVAEYLRHADVPGHHGDAGSGLHVSAPASAISLLIPFFFDHLGWRTTLPPDISAFLVVPYLGLVPVTLAALAPRRRMTVFFAVYAVLSLLKAYGAPAINLVGVLPGINRVLVFRYNQPIVAFCVAALMAIALDAVTGQIRHRWSPRRVIGIAGSIVLVIAGFVVYHAEWIAAAGGMPSLLRAGLGVAIVTLVATLLWIAVRWPRLAPSVNVALVVVLVLELFSYVPKRFSPRIDAFATSGFVQALRRDRSVFRIDALDGVLQPNTSSGYGFGDIRVLENFYPDRYLPLIHASLISATPDPMTTATAGTRAELLGSQALLDLLNVKYVVTLAPLDSLDLWDAARRGDPIRIERIAIEGVSKTFIVQHSPSRMTFPLHVPERGGILRLSVGLHPDVSPAMPGRVVRYRLAVRGANGVESPRFELALDPARIEDRRWHDAAIDLRGYRGTTVTLALMAERAGGDVSVDGGWGDIRLDSSETRSTWELVYDGEVKIYRNTRALPRAFLVHRAEVVASPRDALARVTAAGFDPRRAAILEEPWSQEPPAPAVSEPETVDVVQYEPQRVRLAVKAAAPALLVLSDIFYPHWQATIDGRPTKILRADYAVRAVAVPPGVHDVTFEYRPIHFYVASALSLATLIGALAMAAVRWQRQRAVKER
jgi:hypothetical protein